MGFYNESLDGFIRSLQVTGIVPLLAATLGVWNAWLGFRTKQGWGANVRSVIVALALIGFLWTAWMAGFLSWSINY